MISKMNVTMVVLVSYTYMLMTELLWCVLALRFNDDPSSERKILPQYDDPGAEEVFLSFVYSFCHLSHSYCDFVLKLNACFQGLTLDARGRFTGEAEKKLEEVIFSCPIVNTKEI